MVHCQHGGNPAWAQNDAMMQAYLEGVTYFFRVNDDTKILVKNWTEKFIENLSRLDPPFIGVVGPVVSEGKTSILTYDFVHYTHIDIFGYYYPRVFTHWWADDWITSVYSPDRAMFVEEVKVRHTAELGTRYQVDWGPASGFKARVQLDQEILKR